VPVAGHWTWTLTWTGSNGVTVNFSLDRPCACSWAWNWIWTGEPGTTSGAAPALGAPSASAQPTTPPPEAAPPQVTQSNVASATASAFVTSTQAQTVVSAPRPAAGVSPAITQQITASQLAQAWSQAVQTDPSNLNVTTAGVLSTLTQTSTATSVASAVARFTAGQTVSIGADASLQNPASGSQSVVSSQTASAAAETVQAHAFNLNGISSAQPSTALIGDVRQTNESIATAFAQVLGSVVQALSQYQGGTGLQSDLAAQAATVSQASNASAQTSQTNVGNVNEVAIPAFGVSNPALSQLNHIGSYASTSSSSALAQTVNQAFSTSSDSVSVDLQANQEGNVTQSGEASSAQAQANRTNAAGWDGIVSPPEASVPALQSGPAQIHGPASAPTQSSVAFGSPSVRPPALPALPGIPGVPGFVVERPSPGGPVAAPEESPRSGWQRLRLSTGPRTAAAGPSSPSGPAPACGPRCEPDPFGVIAGAHGLAIGDPVAALSRLFRFALPGAGRVQLETSAPGGSTFIAPLERPG
jgi:hypothetical protein